MLKEKYFSTEIYKPRRIEFNQLKVIDDWAVKVYTITHKQSFGANEVLENAIANLSKWFKKTRTIGFEPYDCAFLIVHEGKDAVWTLFNWWVSGGILKSMTFSTNLELPNEFVLKSEEGFMACVWELKAINFEREMWIEHILKKAENPDFTRYLDEKLNGYF